MFYFGFFSYKKVSLLVVLAGADGLLGDVVVVVEILLLAHHPLDHEGLAVVVGDELDQNLKKKRNQESANREHGPVTISN